MELMEIILLVIGIGVFVVSFLLPASKEADLKSAKELAQGEIRQMVTEEMNQIRQQVDDTVEEAITYAMEKTERSLSRISNEKIMAVNEYSDTVLAEINKNHQEVMFLYDMLNDKHVSLKKTVTAVEKKAKEAEAIAQEAFQTLKPQKLEPVAEPKETVPEKKTAEPEAVRIEDFYRKPNSNEAILALYKQGKDKVQIAKELGLGVGEVELVIGLFKERKL
ncbi:MAG: hypothetical protein IJN16_08240 [Lachnospiraceae bacterium]|nr:hypothetical protein [Lachnospiraceae bacterium]